MCDACRSRGDKAKDKHYSIEDFEEPRYRKAKRRSRKYCAKSKTKEKCEFTVKVIKWSYNNVDEYGRSYQRGYYVKACPRCHRQNGFYAFSTQKYLPPSIL